MVKDHEGDREQQTGTIGGQPDDIISAYHSQKQGSQNAASIKDPHGAMLFVPGGNIGELLL